MVLFGVLILNETSSTSSAALRRRKILWGTKNINIFSKYSKSTNEHTLSVIVNTNALLTVLKCVYW